MIKTTFVCGLMTMAVLATASAEEFPLTFRTIPAKDVMSFPGGYGASGQLRLVKPAGLKKEPKAVSRHPLYGEFRGRAGEASLVFRLDESKGNGKGYDQLIVDMNQNGDLTDDSAAEPVVLATDRKMPAQAIRQRLFGPIKTHAGTMIAGERPVYYAEAYINDPSSLRASQDIRNFYAGQLRLKAGWFLDTTVELKGLKQRVGVYDADSNTRLGDMPRPQTYSNAGEEQSWSFGPADALLVDVDGSGTFDRDIFDGEAFPYGPVLYLGVAPHKVALAPDFKSLRVEPWTEPLAVVTLQPHGDQVKSVTLAKEAAQNQWQLIRAVVADGEVKVPPGNYRLYACELLGKGAPRDQMMASATQRLTRKPVSFAAGKANGLRCGAPLEIKVTADKRVPQASEFGLPRNKRLASDSEYLLAINATIQGVGSEVYSTYAKGEKFGAKPPEPTFTITDGSGKKLAEGKLEYG
ncbi:MAG: hypothetical protein NT154_29410 [Verrucomicrobia bacterium]|nr:hypothetical protein [Verrucomicrobiota bacterium]